MASPKKKMNTLGAVKLTVSFLKEGEKFIAYCPSLDLSAYGDTFEEAKKAFEETVEIFFEELARKGTLEEVLTECGWTKAEKPQPRWEPPSFITNIEEEFSIPA